MLGYYAEVFMFRLWVFSLCFLLGLCDLKPRDAAWVILDLLDGVY